MKSTNNKKKEFTLQDFEKGLMLAGYISPINVTEVNEKKQLADFDKAQAKIKREIYFKRVVLAAEIVNELKDEITFGRVKLQKLVYLCENVVHMNLSQERYKKFAAGPFDNKFMHSINIEFMNQKWFGVKTIKDGNFSKQQYFELERTESYKEYYSRYYSEYNYAVHRIIDLFRNEKTRFAELIATLFFCWKEIEDEKQLFSFELMCHKFYTWAEEKQQFTKSEISDGIKWMETQKITPLTI